MSRHEIVALKLKGAVFQQNEYFNLSIKSISFSSNSKMHYQLRKIVPIIYLMFPKTANLTRVLIDANVTQFNDSVR